MNQPQSIEKTALTNLICNEDYARKVIPFMKKDYFTVREEKLLFEEILKFVEKYKKIPTKTSLSIEVESRKDLTQDEHDKIVKLISSLKPTSFIIFDSNKVHCATKIYTNKKRFAIDYAVKKI